MAAIKDSAVIVLRTGRRRELQFHALDDDKRSPWAWSRLAGNLLSEQIAVALILSYPGI